MVEERAHSARIFEMSPDVENKSTSIPLLFSALAIGALLGAMSPATEQRAVDGSLVLAGIISYPPESPMGQYYLNSWTLLHQLGALFLRVGFTQVQVSAFFSIVPAAFLVCAYTMILQGMCRRPLFSLCAAPLCYLINPFAWLFSSPEYPTMGILWAQATEHTYGLWGQIGALWVIGCVAGGRAALAGGSSLVLIAIHPVLGAYMTSLLLASVLLGRALFGFEWKEYLRGAVWGGLVTITSLAVYLMLRHASALDTDTIAYEAYMRFWDAHRNRPITFRGAIRIATISLLAILALFAFLRFAGIERRATIVTVLLSILALSVSTVTYFAAHLVPGALPQIAIRVAPTRLLNIQAYASAPMIVGMVVYVTDHLKMVSHRIFRNFSVNPGKAKDGIVCLQERLFKLFDPYINSRIPLIMLLVLICALDFGRLKEIAKSIVHKTTMSDMSRVDSEDDVFWSRVRSAGINGLVLTSWEATRPSFYHGHLAIALDVTSFDFIPYLPYTVKAVAKIIQEGYGVPFFQPPPEIWYRGGLVADEGRIYWARLTSGDWLKISQNLSVVAVVAPADWLIELPVAIRGKRFSLYRITP